MPKRLKVGHVYLTLPPNPLNVRVIFIDRQPLPTHAELQRATAGLWEVNQMQGDGEDISMAYDVVHQLAHSRPCWTRFTRIPWD